MVKYRFCPWNFYNRHLRQYRHGGALEHDYDLHPDWGSVRGYHSLYCGSQETKGVVDVADDIFRVPKTLDDIAPVLSVVVSQLFAYYIAKARNTEIDQPRNLAKSVTVE